MIANINSSITICGLNLLVHSISSNRSEVSVRKTYYQHRHPGFELHYIHTGECKAICGEKRYILESETLFLVPPGVYHNLIHNNSDTLRLCVNFNLQKGDASLSEKSSRFYSMLEHIEPITVNLHGSEAQWILNKIYQHLISDEDDIYKNDKILTLCSSLLLELIPHIAVGKPSKQQEPEITVREDVNFMIDSFLGTNFMSNNAKSRMASELYVSPRQLQRIIKKNYGMSYRQKLSETRIHIATDLLCNTDMQIHEIAEILGYSCSANFSAFIKRATGKTPSQIRNEK